MIVTCPGCDSNYRVPNEKVPPGGARMRCPLCSTDFLAKLPDDDSPDTPPTPKPKVPPLPAAASSTGFSPPVPAASGGLPLPAARPNPFAKAPASGDAAASPPPFAERSLPPYASPPGTYPSPPAGPAPAAAQAPFATAAPPGPASPAPLDSGAYGPGNTADSWPAPMPAQAASPAPFALGAPPPPQPAHVPPPPPPQQHQPAYEPPPPPPAAAYAPAPMPPAPTGFAPPYAAIPPPVPAGAYPGAPAAPPPPPPAALVGPSPPPAAPFADGGADVLDFDPLDDDIFGEGRPSGSSAVPRDVTGIFPRPDLEPPFAAPPPPAGRPPPLAPQPISSPNAGYAAPPAPPPASPFGGSSYPPTGAPAPTAGPFGGASYPPAGVPADDPFGEPGFSADLFTDEGAAPQPPGPAVASPTPSGASFPLAGAAPGDDDDPFAAVFDAALAAAAVPAPAQSSPGAASASFSEPPDSSADEGKAGMKAALSRAMDAKRRAGALKEEQSPTSRGFNAPAFSLDDPSQEVAVEAPASPTANPTSRIAEAQAQDAPPASAPPSAEPPPASAKPPRRPLPRAVKEGVAWGALAVSALVLVGGLLLTGWTLGKLPLDDTLMPIAERQLGVRPPWSSIGLDQRPLNELEKAAEKAREERDLAVEASAWRRVLARAPEHEDARRRLRKLLALLGEPRELDDVARK